MEIVYLICSIAYAFLTSSVLSLLLALRSIPTFFLSPRAGAVPSSPTPSDDVTAPPVQMYEGRVTHLRRRPCRHAFEYPVRYALIDLDIAVASSSPLLLPPSFFAGHLSSDQARRIAGTDGSVLLLTIPPSVGYEQNPLSVYYCYDVAPAAATAPPSKTAAAAAMCLKKCIAEVTNTPWGERASFVFNPGSDLVAKPLHVSPFMDMLGSWSIHADAPGDNLFLAISVQHPTLGNYFTATLSARRVSTSSSPLSPALFFWLMPQKVAVWIYWQALKLWWKNVSFICHPKYSNRTYREDALLRNRELHCSLRNGENKNGHLRSTSMNDGKSEARWCVWRDAEWPWS